MSDEQLDEHLENRLESYLDFMDESCEFSTSQRAKLELAGSGDILAFIRRIDKMRKVFADADQNQIGNMWQEIQPIKRAYHKGIFSHDSLVKKVMRVHLDSEQARRLAEVERQQCKFVHHAKILQFVSRWEAMHPLKQEQRDEFIAL